MSFSPRWRHRRLQARPLYLGLRFAFAFAFTLMAMISALYRVQSAGLNPLQLVLVGTVLEAAVFVFEIPTGIIADLVSRRLSVVIGYLLIGLGFVVEGALPVFGTILLAQVIWGVGATFTSGAEDAWLADEVGEGALAAVYVRSAQLGQLGTLLGIGVAVLLGRVALRLPMLVSGGVIIALGLFLAVTMPETGFRRPERAVSGPGLRAKTGDAWREMGGQFLAGLRAVRGRRLLVIIVGVGAIFGLASEGLDRLWEAHLLANFAFPDWFGLDTVAWFGIVNVAVLLVTLFATELVRRNVTLEGPGALKARGLAGALLLAQLPVVGGVIVFGLAGNLPLAVGAYITLATSRRLAFPFLGALTNRGLPSAVRATILSMLAQVDAIGQLVGGPIIGLVATRVSLRAAMVVVGLILAPSLLLFALARRVPEAAPVVAPE